MRSGTINLILAVSNNWVIGDGDKLLWHCPEDMKFFKKTTKGFPVIMGRKTFFSIGKSLPNRRNYVLTKNRNFSCDGVQLINDEQEIFDMANKENVFIIGGKSLYEKFAQYATQIFLTVININIDGDNLVKIDKDVLLKNRKATLLERYANCEMYLYL